LKLKLKSLRSFLDIKRCQGTKSRKVIKLAQSLLIKVVHICANRGNPVNGFLRGRRADGVTAEFVPVITVITNEVVDLAEGLVHDNVFEGRD
jgi:hypothetical protein